jgi:hypothetical protein
MEIRTLVSAIFREIGMAESMFDNAFQRNAPKEWKGETRAYHKRKARVSYKAKVRRERDKFSEPRSILGLGKRILAMNGPRWIPDIEKDLPSGDRE